MAYIEITVRVKENNAAFYRDDTGTAKLELSGAQIRIGMIDAGIMDALIVGAMEDHERRVSAAVADDDERMPQALLTDDDEPPF